MSVLELEATRLSEVDEQRLAATQQFEHTRRLGRGGSEVEVGHPPSEQRVAVTEVVMDIERGSHAGKLDTRLVDLCEPGRLFGQRATALVAALQRGQGHRVPQRPDRDGVALGLVGVKELVG